MQHKPLFFFVLGLTLSSMFFYPLTTSLNDSLFSMHWQTIHSYELLLSWLGIALLLSCLLWFSFNLSKIWKKLLSIGTISILPFSSMTIHILRQIGLKSTLIKFSQEPFFYLSLSVFFLFTIVLFFKFRSRDLGSKIISFYTIILMIISPLSLLSFYTAAKSHYYINKYKQPIHVLKSNPQKNRMSSKNIYIFLFDEMSYQWLYKNNTIQNKYRNIREFASLSDNYHIALAPSTATSKSMPQLMLSKNDLNIVERGNNIYSVDNEKRFTPLHDYKNIFYRAKSKGYYTVMYGWAIQYEKILGDSADECTSFSLYNYSRVNSNFSIIDPIITTMLIWPYQFPFGLSKIPLYSNFHKKNMDKIVDLGLIALSKNNPSFVFLHFPIPHLPFIYNKNGYDFKWSSFTDTDENYENQLRYVDKIFGKYMEKLKTTNKFNDSIIVLMADHNYRIKTQPEKHSQIPMIIKRVNQKNAKNFYMPVHATDLIDSIIGD